MSKRREFMRGAAIGALAFTIGGVEILLTPGAARAQGATLRLLKPDEVETLEALGETLVPGARAAGIAYFIDSQISASSRASSGGTEICWRRASSTSALPLPISTGLP